MKVLMVDADPNGHAAIADVLTQRGCQLLEVDDRDEALGIAHEQKPAIAIVDVLTLRMKNFSRTTSSREKLKSNSRLRQMKIQEQGIAGVIPPP
jgi:DNA-binding response OmpR family regulator